MPLAIAAFHGGRLAVWIVIMILSCVFVLKSGGTSALKFVILLMGIVIIKEVLLRFWGPTAEYAFTAIALTGVIFVYIIRRKRSVKGSGLEK